MPPIGQSPQFKVMKTLDAQHYRGFFSLDPCTTVLYLLVLNIGVLSITNQAVTVTGFLFTVLMLVTVQAWRFLAGYIAFFGMCQFLYLVVQPAFPNGVVTFLVTFAYFLAKYAVVFGTGAYFITTTTAAEFVAAMKRMHLPDALIVPIAVMFRFFPAVYEEFWAVINAMKLRQLYRSGWEILLKPLTTIEYVIVPLLTSVITIGEDLSASAMVRGLGSPERPTSVVTLGFRWWDGVVVIMTVSFAVFAILTKVQVI